MALYRAISFETFLASTLPTTAVRTPKSFMGDFASPASKLTHNQEYDNDKPIYQPKPVDLRVEDVAVGCSDKHENCDGTQNCDACNSQVHIPSERPGNIAMNPTNAVAVPEFGVGSFREMHGHVAETVGLV